MEFLEHFRFLYDGVAFFFTAEGWKNLVMILIGGLLIYLALAKDFEPALLMPMGFCLIHQVVGTDAQPADQQRAIHNAVVKRTDRLHQIL